MKDAILIELAQRWEREAVPPAPRTADCAEPPDLPPAAEQGRALARERVAAFAEGQRLAKAACASDLKALIRLIGESQ